MTIQRQHLDEASFSQFDIDDFLIEQADEQVDERFDEPHQWEAMWTLLFDDSNRLVDIQREPDFPEEFNLF
jgi:hypothetical protein